jgi:hypothetical protein
MLLATNMPNDSMTAAGVTVCNLCHSKTARQVPRQVIRAREKMMDKGTIIPRKFLSAERRLKNSINGIKTNLEDIVYTQLHVHWSLCYTNNLFTIDSFVHFMHT